MKTEELHLTDNETNFIRTLNQYYLKYGVINADYFNVFGTGNRTLRGVLSSLIKKNIIEWAGADPSQKDYFNPLYQVVIIDK